MGKRNSKPPRFGASSLAVADDFVLSLVVDPLVNAKTHRMTPRVTFSATELDDMRKWMLGPPARLSHEILLPLLETSEYMDRFDPELASEPSKRFTSSLLDAYCTFLGPDSGFKLAPCDRYSRENRDGAKVISTKTWEKGEVVKTLKAISAELTDEAGFVKKGLNDFSIMTSSRRGCKMLWLGPASFINHDCSPNLRLVGSEETSFLVLKKIEIGEEVTFLYANTFFGEGNCDCECHSCEEGHVGAFLPVESVHPVEQESRTSGERGDEGHGAGHEVVEGSSSASATEDPTGDRTGDAAVDSGLPIPQPTCSRKSKVSSQAEVEPFEGVLVRKSSTTTTTLSNVEARRERVLSPQQVRSLIELDFAMIRAETNAASNLAAIHVAHNQVDYETAFQLFQKFIAEERKLQPDPRFITQMQFNCYIEKLQPGSVILRFCPLCRLDKTFSESGSFAGHYRSVHFVLRPKLHCKICKLSSTRAILSNHITTQHKREWTKNGGISMSLMEESYEPVQHVGTIAQFYKIGDHPLLPNDEPTMMSKRARVERTSIPVDKGNGLPSGVDMEAHRWSPHFGKKVTLTDSWIPLTGPRIRRGKGLQPRAELKTRKRQPKRVREEVEDSGSDIGAESVSP